MDVPSQETVGLLSSDEGGAGGSSDSPDSSEDEVTEHVPPVMAARAQVVVPTISVTPHSPGVLDDSLQQLRQLHAAVQRMRAAPLPLMQAGGISRISTSCPSLCKDGADVDYSSPTHLDFYPHSRKGSSESRQWGLWDRRDEGRRSSWAALEPTARQPEPGRQRSTLNGHSASLSSMESEGEARPRHSTHSLNDNDLAKDFEKVTAALLAGTSVAEGARLAARLPLQKSVSTPSIVAAVQPAQPPPATNILSGGGASETESDEDASAATVGAATQLPGRRNNTHQEHLGLHRLAFLEQAAYDHHAEKRRKRGSLFFRKKKDKSRKAAHAWQAATSAADCDWCGRALADKPAFYCEHCTMTVHQTACKDYIVECNKPKSSKTSVGKSLSAASGKSSKRSSVSSQSQNPNSTGHMCNDDKDSDHKHDQSNASDDAGAAEWPEAYLTPDLLGDEAILLGLGASEPDTWAAGAPKGLAKAIGDRETKRQEHIYELILTEKHHCLTIRLMQKMFAEGMVRFPGISSAQVSRMFPCVEELWTLHAALLARLRARQRAAAQIATVADILADTFAAPARHRLKAAYGNITVEELWTLHAALLARLRARQRAAAQIATVADILADTFAAPARHRLKAAYGNITVEELWTLHAALLARLRARQRAAAQIATVADILADTFAAPARHRLKAAYGNITVEELWTLHAALLARLRARQRAAAQIATVADILADTFAAPARHRLKAAYGNITVEELWTLHAALLARLRARQRAAAQIATVADILADTFAAPARHRLKAAYGNITVEELWTLHAALLARLRARQRAAAQIATVADILADTFAAPARHRLKAAYGNITVEELWTLHAALLARLRARQRAAAQIATVADILADTFAAPARHRLKAAYGNITVEELWTLHAALLARLRARQRAAAQIATVADILADTFAAPARHRLKAAYGNITVEELWTLHAALLARLRARQRAAAQIATVADILADTFAAPARHRLKAAYGEFCSRHRDAVDVFKECCAREPRLARFIRKCQQNPLLRKKGVPECVLFVAQRLTKYPLLLEPLLKTAGDDVNERELLQKALCGVKEILVDVDNQVAAKEREDRKLEIYHRIDAKSFANFKGRKFKKSDILQGNRSLKFEGVATLMQGRSKMQTLLLIVLTDVLFFLHDNNNKYTFFTPDNKTGVVSLVKLLVREKAGAEGRGLYLICSGPAEPEMFELRVHRPKDIHAWIHNIRLAVSVCPGEPEEAEGAHASAEERQRALDARHESIRLITEALRVKDREHATLLEEKMALHMKMVGHTGSSALDVPSTGASAVFPGGLVFPEYVRLAAPQPDTHALWQEVCRVVKDALEASSGAWSGGGGLGRSTSSAGERHSCAYESPALPRRADTFAGFDAATNRHRGVNLRLSTDTPEEVEGETEAPEPHERERVYEQTSGDSALKLQHAVYTLTCIVWQQLTTIHSLEAQVMAWRAAPGGAARGHEAQLEELRHLQARLTADRAAWEHSRARDHAAIADEKRQLQAAREELLEQQKDVEQQRERLFRRLERLQQHGSQEEIASVGTLSPDSSVSDTTRRKEPKWRNSRGSTGSEGAPPPRAPPPQLLSAQNESRATAAAVSQMVIKQQLPLKLASGKSQQPPPGYHRLHESPSEHLSGLVIQHTRTGSSPAPLPSQAPPNNKATRTNTYPRLPDKFRARTPDAAPDAVPAPGEEEVIYF